MSDPPSCGRLTLPTIWPADESTSSCAGSRSTRMRPPSTAITNTGRGYVRSFCLRSRRQTALPTEPAISPPRAASATCALAGARSVTPPRSGFSVPVTTKFPLWKQSCANRLPVSTMFDSCWSHASDARTTMPCGDQTSMYSHDWALPTRVAARFPSTATSFTGATVRISRVGVTATSGGGAATSTRVTLPK